MSSAAESISAWKAVFDWPSMVAALSRARQLVASSSAAFRKTASRSSQGQADHSRRAAAAASIGLGHLLARGLVPVGEDVSVVVRHHGLALLVARQLTSADHERDLDPLVGRRAEALLQLRPLG